MEEKIDAAIILHEAKRIGRQLHAVLLSRELMERKPMY